MMDAFLYNCDVDWYEKNYVTNTLRDGSPLAAQFNELRSCGFPDSKSCPWQDSQLSLRL